jgi:hypothetical protein
MTSYDILAVAVAGFVYVGLRAFQQLNVVAGARLAVFVTSHFMAFGDVYLVSQYARHGTSLLLCLAVGTSQGLGCLAAMWLRKKMIKQ